MAVSLSEFEKALKALEEVLVMAEQNLNDPIMFKVIRDATIQRFEFCVELAWKVSSKILGLASSSAAKMVIRDMAQNSLIQDTQIWFDFVEARNKSSHSYDENIAREVYLAAQNFVPEGQKLLKTLKRK